ncbi:hypothetical protein H5410_032597 [Solanum commersonii]|uniref:Uncharacterized protein n=1 Tax=Solanum commersonii TaxID=4109 RepID=A0A9J5YKD3_SOLCO|nr:hypothetical protein H5410_032597 [Solanum commersonii]
MSQSSVNIEKVNENSGCGYFRWIDPSLENADESSLMNRFIDGQNPIDRLKRKVKELEEERDSLKFQLNENEEKIVVLNKKLKEVKLQRDWENVKLNQVVIVFLCQLTIKWFFNIV